MSDQEKSTKARRCRRKVWCGECSTCRRTYIREKRRQSIRQLAAGQGGVVSRNQLYDAGWTRWQIEAELRAKRWTTHGRQTVAMHTGPLQEAGLWWTAVFEVGAGAALDGVTALCAAGLTGFEDRIHVSTPKSARPRRPRRIIVHETRRRQPGDVLEDGIPRVRPAVAAIRAGLWAQTDKQAALVLAMTVQQSIASPDTIAEALSSVRRHRRRRFLKTVLADVAGGSESIGELEFLRLCREYGLPDPDRQNRRVTEDGVVFIDSEWSSFGVVVEIEGVHHQQADRAIADAVRQNELTIEQDRVLRVPVLGLRTEPDRYMSQLVRLMKSQGWTPTGPLRPKRRRAGPASLRT